MARRPLLRETPVLPGEGYGVEDEEILELYFQRQESAIVETERKHGPYCRSIANNLLWDRRDADECVADTWYAAWTRIPPDRPSHFRTFLGRIVRNLAVSRYRKNHAEKRGGGLEVLLSELEDCLPTGDVQETLEQKELAQLISDWLDGLPAADCVLFVRRYWYGEAVRDLAHSLGGTPNRVTKKLQRLRGGLRQRLEKEGVPLS